MRSIPPAGPTDVALPDGRAAWIDGGSRSAFPPGTFRDQAIVHYLGARDGLLVPVPPFAEPVADLAPDQLAAVSHPSGPARIIAPAGSGKTRVLTERRRHLIRDREYDRRHVLAVVYNKRAQEEMERRCVDFRPRIQTLNALGWEILREVEPKIELISENAARQLMERVTIPSVERLYYDLPVPKITKVSEQTPGVSPNPPKGR